MGRLRYAGLTGTIGSGNLTNSATSHTFTAPLTYANGVSVPTLSGTDYFLLSILATDGTLSEVVNVTAYNSGTGVATIARAQQGTSGVSHTSGDKVLLSAYADDFAAIAIDAGETVPSGTPAGPLVFRKAGWLSTLLADSPAVLLTLDETSGVFVDSSGNGRDFTAGTGVTRNLTPLIADGGKAASADGSATAGHNIGSLGSAGGIGQTGTLSCVVSIPSGSIASSTMLAVGTSSAGWGLGIGNGAGGSGRRLGGICAGVNYINSGYDFPAPIGSRPIVVHLAMTLASHVFTFFVNGWAVGTNTISELSPGASLFVGGGPEACASGIIIDHAAFFPTVLSDARIKEHAAVLMGGTRVGPVGLPVHAIAGPVGWWDGSKIQPLGLT